MNHSILCEKTALLVIHRHLATETMAHYAANLTMQALVELARITGSKELIEKSIMTLEPFFTGKVEKVAGVYDKVYRSGGNASALLLKYGYAPDITGFLVSKAEELITSHPRHASGVFGHSKGPEKIWIDTLWGICPFLGILGKITGRRDFIDESIRQIIETHKLLLDASVGLYHQSINFAGPGLLSEDHWSRGNGWGAIALAELITEIPDNREILEIYRNLMGACIQFQDEDGMWHQEMTVKDSYVETSGSGLILYALGRGLELGLVPDCWRANFLKGLSGLLRYISLDGSVFNSCIGCLCPGNGTIADYMARPWKLNDVHSFGPVALAFTQALRLGINELEIS
jgi:unsaturated rhamnogalacturonyl hydrolase